MGAARMEGFEPPTRVLETLMIPFHHTRVYLLRPGQVTILLREFCRPTDLLDQPGHFCSEDGG